MPAAADIQLPRTLWRYDSNGFDDIFEMMFQPPSSPPPDVSASFLSAIPLSSFLPSSLSLSLSLSTFSLFSFFRFFVFSFFREVVSSVQSLPTEFHIDAGDGERPSSSYIIIEQNIMLADERPAAKMYYDRHNSDATASREREREGERAVRNRAIIFGTIDNVYPAVLLDHPPSSDVAAVHRTGDYASRDYILHKYNDSHCGKMYEGSLAGSNAPRSNRREKRRNRKAAFRKRAATGKRLLRRLLVVPRRRQAAPL